MYLNLNLNLKLKLKLKIWMLSGAAAKEITYQGRAQKRQHKIQEVFQMLKCEGSAARCSACQGPQPMCQLISDLKDLQTHLHVMMLLLVEYPLH